jgi:hypothetical protein
MITIGEQGGGGTQGNGPQTPRYLELLALQRGELRWFRPRQGKPQTARPPSGGPAGTRSRRVQAR